jgi:hypothetical protein
MMSAKIITLLPDLSAANRRSKRLPFGSDIIKACAIAREMFLKRQLPVEFMTPPAFAKFHAAFSRLAI